MTTAYINRIATSVPPHDVHRSFIAFAEGMLPEGTTRSLFKRMVRMSAIEHRYSFLQPIASENGIWRDAEDLYATGRFPGTARRMETFEKFAPQLAACALKKLGLTAEDRERVTHVIVTSCTGLYAPGLDYDIVENLGLNPSVERTMIGFMGCYAAINALKSAHHIVRSMPDAVVLILNLELCTLHLQETQELEQMLSFLLFADGCAACMVSAKPSGLGIDSFLALRIPETSHLITWKIREMGFDMHLSGQGSGGDFKGHARGAGARSRRAENAVGDRCLGGAPWRKNDPRRGSKKGLGLREDSLHASREVLAQFGNMSSATVMFVLQSIMRAARSGQQGCAMSFGPGVTAETMLFHAA